MATTVEPISKDRIDKMAIILTGREDDIKAHFMVKLEGDRYAYEVVLKTDRSVFDPDQSTVDEFFKIAKTKMLQVLRGETELNAIIA